MSRRVNRRQFLQVGAGAAAATGLLPAMHLDGQTGADATHAWPENGTLIPDTGWHLWVDREAEWKQDTIYLPEEITQDAGGVVLGKGQPLPVNAPTGGWAVLAAGGLAEREGIGVVLPSTVEQHSWGRFGAGADGKPRPYTPEEYRYAATNPPTPASDDAVPRNGAYFGVSWWWREIEIPAEMQGKRIVLHVRGAHLRAEVYLNEKMVGYSIMEELPFEAELTHAARPGQRNVLAVRITNPFGRFDWVDGLNEQWGAVKLYRSHGFGGLDRGITISAHDGVRIKDAWVLNSASAGEISVGLTVERTTQRQVQTLPSARLSFELIEASSGRVVESHSSAYYYGVATDSFHVWGSVPPTQAQKEQIVRYMQPMGETFTFKDFKQWELDTPHLYHLRVKVKSDDGQSDTRTILFGFRSFGVDGLGTNALFRLNGRRMKIYTAISWGYWGINGMWPTPELAEKEVTQAKKLNLTCLNFHRNLAKEDVLRAQDRLGLLRSMEPGGGKMAIGKLPAGVTASANSIKQATSEADRFAQRYIFTKCVEMVKAFRSHPCVIEYCLQNELGADLKNPDTIAILEAMRREDPSRLIVLNDGFVAPPRRAAQAWFAPWDEKLHRSDEEEWGGWWNQHQGAGDQWYDEFYKSPTDFTYKSSERKVISEYGEMEGCATPDNHSLMLHQLADPKGTGLGDQPPNESYDLQDHREILAVYDKFLDKWGFRKAFPATEKLWTALGKKCYDTWQNYLENARISDELDFAAISGWETTAIENHSGIVDNLRNFKSDPTPISATLLPVRPVAKQRSMCTALGEAATFDLFLLNDTDAAATGTLRFTAISPAGRLMKLGEFPAPAWQRDRFSYLVKEDFVTPRLTEEGLWRFRFELSSLPSATQTKEIWVTNTHAPLAVQVRSVPVAKLITFPGLMVAVSGIPDTLRRSLSALPGVHLVEFVPGKKYDVIVSGGLAGAREAEPTQTQLQPGRLADGILDAVRAGTPLLAIPRADALSDGVATQLAAAGAFSYAGSVGDLRAPWMGNWYFIRRHAVYEGMPVDQAMGIHYQAHGRESNGLLIDRAPGGAEVEIITGYSRDHDRQIGAGTFATKLGKGEVLYQRVPELHPVLEQRFLANALVWLAYS
ncbi:MAG TPA: glycoside hydrolase [Acidobacteriaceae bacterium]